ncbi:hypothetical protein, partial [Mycobacteroides abscessus]|uniref:hypothetical protein n=1 Tax=Mycobacteroides abscessus TaxID=36809 RepID=UPI000A4D0552
FDLKIILGKVRPFLRRLTEAHPQVLIIALPGHLVASLDTVLRAHHREALHWRSGDTVTLRGRTEPTELAVPV